MTLEQLQPTPEELRVVLETGFYLREAGRLEDAEAIFRGLMELLPDSDLPRVALGTVEMQRGRTGAALAAYEDALSLCPSSLYAHVHHAEALLFDHRREEAEEELNQVIASDPASPHSRTARVLLDAAEAICAQAANVGHRG
jgi:tetratricopeptide (TPR) repeat protein